MSLPKPLGAPDGSSANHVCGWRCLTAPWFLPAGKPLIISEFGMWRPMSVRNAVYQALYEELLSAKSSGLPVAGAELHAWQWACSHTASQHNAAHALHLRSSALHAELAGAQSVCWRSPVYMSALRVISLQEKGPRKAGR